MTMARHYQLLLLQLCASQVFSQTTCTYQMAGGNPQQQNSVPCVGPDVLPTLNAVKWDTAFGQSWSRGVSGQSPVLDASGNAYISLVAGTAAVDTQTGATLWSVQSPPSLPFTPALSTVSGSQELLLFRSNGPVLRALYAATGSTAWTYTVSSSNCSAPTVAPGGLVLVAAPQGKVLALNQRTGALVWSWTAGNNWNPCAIDPFDSLTLDPTNTFVLVSSACGSVYGIRVDTGQAAYQVYISGYYYQQETLVAPIAAGNAAINGGTANNVAFLLSSTGMLSSINSNTGGSNWRVNAGVGYGNSVLQLAFSPAPSGGRSLILVLYDAGISAFDCLTGTLQWTWTCDTTGLIRPVAMTIDGRGYVYVSVYSIENGLSRSGYVVVSRDSGRVLQALSDGPSFPAIVGPPVIGRDRTLLGVTYRGTLMAIGTGVAPSPSPSAYPRPGATQTPGGGPDGQYRGSAPGTDGVGTGFAAGMATTVILMCIFGGLAWRFRRGLPPSIGTAMNNSRYAKFGTLPNSGPLPGAGPAGATAPGAGSGSEGAAGTPVGDLFGGLHVSQQQAAAPARGSHWLNVALGPPAAGAVPSAGMAPGQAQAHPQAQPHGPPTADFSNHPVFKQSAAQASSKSAQGPAASAPIPGPWGRAIATAAGAPAQASAASAQANASGQAGTAPTVTEKMFAIL